MTDVDTSREAVERRAARIERYAEQRKTEAVNWAPGSTLAAEVLAHAAVIAADAATLRALLAVVDRTLKQRQWLEKNRPELHAAVSAALKDRHDRLADAELPA